MKSLDSFTDHNHIISSNKPDYKNHRGNKFTHCGDKVNCGTVQLMEYLGESSGPSKEPH